MVADSNNTSLARYVDFSIGRIEEGRAIFEGRVRIDGIAIIMGPPMSGKTLFLRTLFSSVYYLNRKIVTRDMQLIVENIGDVRVNFVEKDGNVEKYLGEIRCQKEGELVMCDDRIDGYLSINAYYLSSHREAVIKYGIAVFEPEMSTSELLVLAATRLREDENRNKRLKSINERFKELKMPDVKFIGGRLYEVLSGNDKAKSRLDIAVSSSTVVAFAILDKIYTKRVLAQEGRNTLLLIDEPEIHLHPLSMMRLSLILHMLNQHDGVNIVMTTHSPLMYLFVANPELIVSRYGLDEKDLDLDLERASKNVVLHIARDRKITEHPPTSFIPTYDDVVMKLLGLSEAVSA